MPEPSPDSPLASLSSDAATTGFPAGAAELQMTAAEADAERPARRRFKGLGIGAWLCIGWLVLIIVGALLAPILPLDDPNDTLGGFIASRGFGADGHLLGGDSSGRDLLSRTVFGARNSLTVGFGAIIIGTVVGGLLGLVAGYYRGRIDTFIVGLLDVLLSFPALVLALALVSVLQDRVSDLLTLVFALGIISIPVLARITRANTLVWSQREFVMAARAQGAKDRRIMIREVLPNVLPSAFSIALLGVAVVIVAEAGLGTLGVGLSTQDPTWGNIINDGRADLTSGTTPHIVFVGAAMVFLTVLALNYLGDVVRARFDVREAGI
jgi:peptide/nickel transport system permease protein